jgi:hypothetical protein
MASCTPAGGRAGGLAVRPAGIAAGLVAAVSALQETQRSAGSGCWASFPAMAEARGVGGAPASQSRPCRLIHSSWAPGFEDSDKDCFQGCVGSTPRQGALRPTLGGDHERQERSSSQETSHGDGAGGVQVGQ